MSPGNEGLLEPPTAAAVATTATSLLTVGGRSPYPGFPAGSYKQQPPRSWAMSPYSFAWDTAVLNKTSPSGNDGNLTRLCINVVARANWNGSNTTCSKNLINRLYEIGLSANPAIIEAGIPRCVRAAAVIRANGTVEMGQVKVVGTVKTRAAHSEIHAFSFGRSKSILIGDKVCFYTTEACGSFDTLCGPRDCGIAIWSGPGPALHQCAPSTTMPKPQ
ncbi:hypothetical protein HaLaN_19300 [Haematococcus lacustris]|uniref:Uncharacterized protein n=1 Tax=Haematococcus lacustris TaxID=44745 RepID=A0A699ZGQ6_HAELA|nr:hypothetical protein HaLaN_19300 [Haematococcus lacustris]